MPKTTDGTIALIALIGFALWLFVCLPVIYLPSDSHMANEFLGVKPGEWLLFAATMGLWWATWRLVTGAEKTAERQLRAYVNISVARATQVDFNINYYVEARNFGQTPAYNVRLRFMIELREFPTNRTFDLPNGPNVSAATLPPNTPIHDDFTPPQRLSPTQLSAIAAGNKAVYVYGIITYDDIFEVTRTTEFRYSLGADVGTRNDGALRICEEGNRAT